jgi:hypothetical protein
MRRIDLHMDGVVARARARLWARVTRPRAPILRRLAGLIPGVAAPIDPAEAAAFQEAARESFRTGTTLGARKRLATVPLTESPASLSGAVRPTVSVSAPTAPAVAPAAGPEREPAVIEGPARRQAGDTAPGFLLRTPTSVTPVADDFFDGLVRSVEGDR